MSYAGKNLRYLRKQRGWTQDECAAKLNVKRSLIGAYEEERAEPKLEVLEALSGIFKLSLDELLLNDLSNAKKSTSFLEQRRKLKMTSSSVAEVQFVPVKAAAGYLAGYADPDFIDELNTFTLPMLAPGYYRAFEIIGDSMLPTPSGSVIVGERVEKMNDVKNSNAYIVLSKSDGIVYKRILRNEKSKDKLTLVSDNPVYEPYTMNEDEVLELWKAVYILQKANAVQRWDVASLAGMVNNLQEQVAGIQKKLN